MGILLYLSNATGYNTVTPDITDPTLATRCYLINITSSNLQASVEPSLNNILIQVTNHDNATIMDMLGKFINVQEYSLPGRGGSLTSQASTRPTSSKNPGTTSTTKMTKPVAGGQKTATGGADEIDDDPMDMDAEKEIANKEKELETQQFKDWTVQCPVTDETQKKRCILFYRVLLENGYPLLVFQVSKSPEVDDRFIGVFDVSLGVYLPTGINVIVDETQSMQLSFERCDQNGCYAGTLMNDDILQALKKGDQGKVTFVDVANQKITASISLSGFTAGLRAL